MKSFFILDERSERINGQISFYLLMLTQVALALLIAFKRYIQGLDTSYYEGFNAILLISMLSYWAIRLYLSGILPVVSLRKLAVLYIILVMLIEIPAFLIVGMPEPARWYEVLYPFIGVAVILGFYELVAYLGKRRLQKGLANETNLPNLIFGRCDVCRKLQLTARYNFAIHMDGKRMFFS